MTRFRVPLAAALALGAVSVVAATGAQPSGIASAASVNLTEVAGSPFVANLGGDPVVNPGQSSFTSAAVGDVTGDGRPEIVAGGLNSDAHVYSFGGALVATLDPGDGHPSGHGAVQSSPTLGDLNGDGIDDVVITNLAGRIAAYSLAGGTVQTLYNQYATPAFEGAGLGLFATPALGYLDRDARLDAVTASWGQTLDAWSGPTGEHMPQLRQWVKDTIWSSPAIGDIDGDGVAEIVVGGDCEGAGGVGTQPCSGIGQGGYVWAFNLDGSLQWSYFVRDAVVWSSPALIDLNHDGALDVVVGTGIYFDREGARRIRAIDGASGGLLWEAPTPGRVMGSPSVATINGEGWIWAISEGGALTAWNEGGQQLWQTCISDQPCNTTLGTFGGVAIADVNNDGRLDAVAQGEEHLRVVDALTGLHQASVRTRHPRPLFASYATPTVVEVDGRTHIVQVGLSDANGGYQIDANDDMLVTVWTTGTRLGQAPWPTFKQNMERTSGPLPAVPDPSAFPPLGDPGRGSACFGVDGERGHAAVVNLTPIPQGPGNGVLVSSDTVNPPLASNTNYTPGRIDPNVAIAPIGSDGRVCYINSRHSATHLVADHLGTIAASAYVPATSTGAPSRRIDTRVGLGTESLPIAALGRLCFAVAGNPGDIAIVNLTPVEAQFAGDGQLVSSDVDNPPIASNVNYTIGSADPNVAFAPIGSDGRVCFVNSRHAAIHLVADHLGTIRASAWVAPAPGGAPVRKLDTRIGLGGDMLPPSGRACMSVAGSPGDAAVLNITPVEATGPGNGVLVPSNVASTPTASNVNFAVGTADPNVAIAPIGPDGQVCVVVSSHSAVHVVADHLGTIRSDAYLDATPTGAPDRVLDTRLTGTLISPS